MVGNSREFFGRGGGERSSSCEAGCGPWQFVSFCAHPKKNGLTTLADFCNLSVVASPQKNTTSLAAMFLANRNVRQQNSVHQLPCGHPGYNRYFKTSAGRTKHRHANHPIIMPSDPPRAPTPPLRSPTRPVSPSFQPQNGQDQGTPDWEGSNPLNENDTESGSGGPPTPLHPMESQFYGSGDRLYRNYHPKLTGNVTDFNIKFSVY